MFSFLRYQLPFTVPSRYYVIFSQSYQCRIQDFPEGEASTPKVGVITYFYTENCMKMKEFGPTRGVHP